MRKIIVFTLLLMFIVTPVFAATDWSDFESGRDNVRLEGYQGQPGYIEFQDGSGNTTGYLWMDDTYGSTTVLRYCSADAIDLTTTKLTHDVGMVVDPLD